MDGHADGQTNGKTISLKTKSKSIIILIGKFVVSRFHDKYVQAYTDIHFN